MDMRRLAERMSCRLRASHLAGPPAGEALALSRDYCRSFSFISKVVFHQSEMRYKPFNCACRDFAREVNLSRYAAG